MYINHPAIEAHLSRWSAVSDPVLLEMEREAESEDFPIVGPQVGRLLYQLVRLSGAKRILELGSGFGYSACWLARGMDESGEVILTELSEGRLNRAKAYLAKADLLPRLTFLQGDALELLEVVEGDFDMVLNDVDKHQYPEAFRKVSPRLRKGGLLITDNVLWSGRVLDANPDADTMGVLEYTQLAFESSQFFSTLLPIRDGISISLKILD